MVIKINYKRGEQLFEDETEYLTSSSKNKKKLDLSIKELKIGKKTKVDLSKILNYFHYFLNH
ncbi:MAG: hypothetical protein RLZZ175_1911 [Bacteroidota bacterium]|jgi:hypothetical protein